MVNHKIIFDYKRVKPVSGDVSLSILYFCFFLLLCLILIGIFDVDVNKGELLMLILGEILLLYIIYLSQKRDSRNIKSFIEISAQDLYVLSSTHDIAVRKKWKEIESIVIKEDLIDDFIYIPNSNLIIKYKGSKQTLLQRIFYGEGDINISTSYFTIPIRESNLSLLFNTLLNTTDIAEREAIIKNFHELKETADF